SDSMEVRFLLPLMGDLVKPTKQEDASPAEEKDIQSAASNDDNASKLSETEVPVKAAKPAKVTKGKVPRKRNSKKATANDLATPPSKPTRDKDAPKRPTNAFLMFCRDNRCKLLKDTKSEKAAHWEATRLLADQWKSMPRADKQ